MQRLGAVTRTSVSRPPQQRAHADDGAVGAAAISTGIDTPK
jgi:hypothetical protein